LGVRHVLKRVTRRDQVFRLHAIVELLPCMEWKRQCPLPLALAVSFGVIVARLIGGFPV
jgi:regulation of enolase protein 1 (concanavalin A-like superfamily)